MSNSKIFPVKAFLILICLAFSSSNFAQDEIAKVKTDNFSKFQFGINYSGDVAYRKLFKNGSDSLIDGIIKWMDDKHSPIFGYHTSANLVYNFSPRFGIESGVQFSKKGYRWGSDVWVIEDGEGKLQKNAITTSIDFYSISAPLKANFTFGEKRLKMLVSAGFLFDYLVQNRQVDKFKIIDQTFHKNVYENTSDYKRFNLTPTVSLGLAYACTEKITLRFEPTFRYGLLYTNDFLVQMRLWSAGGNFGVYIGL